MISLRRNWLWRRLKLAAFVTGSLIAACFSHAQTERTGTVQGRVFNPALKEFVRNAEVRLEGTNQVTYTENDGSFQFNRVNAGPATITVAFTGYQPVQESFTVTPDRIVSREISLTAIPASVHKLGDVVKLSAFTVSSEREGNAKAIMEQRRNMNIVTSVSSDLFGDVADGNIGEFLKNLPGVELEYVESEARSVRLGGMESQYVGVSMDGIKLAGADASILASDASRATSLEGFSITSIESIEVSRTTSADTDADSPAGTINMKTKRAFDRKGRRFGFNFNVNLNDEEFNLTEQWGHNDRKNYKWKPNLALEYSESFLNQRLGILISASRASSYTERYIHTFNYNRVPTATDLRPLVLTSLDLRDAPKMILKDAYMMTGDFKVTPRLILSVNAVYSNSDGEFNNRNFVFNAANNNSNANTGRSVVLGDGLTTIRTNGLANNTVRNITKAGFNSDKRIYTRTLAQRFEYRLNAWTFDGAVSVSKSVNDYEALERGFSRTEGGAIVSDWSATRPSVHSHEWTVRQTSGPDWFNLENYTGGTLVTGAGRMASTEIWNVQLNGRWELPFRNLPTSIKVGGKWNEENRKHINADPWQLWHYIGPGGNTLTGFNPTTGVPTTTANGSWTNLGYVSRHVFDTGKTKALTVYDIAGQQGMLPRADNNSIAELFNTRPDQFAHVGATPANYYSSFISSKRDMRQTVTAAFAQADTRVTSKLQVRMGIRVENTANAFREFDPQLRADVIRSGYPVAANGRATTIPGLEYQYFSKPRVTRDSEYHNWFPSVLTKYSFTRNLQLQAGFNKAISRPPIDKLTGIYSFADDANPPRIDAPNANLQPEYSKNYQARLVYYLEPAGEFAVAISQNNIRNLRETSDLTADEFGEDDLELANYIFRTTRNSLEEQRFRNLEFSYRQLLTFLPRPFGGTGLNFNYGRTYANLRRPGMSPHRMGFGLSYNYRRFNGSLRGIWSAKTPVSNYGRFRKHQEMFDLQCGWSLTERLSLYVSGRNIFGKPILEYESPVVEGRDSALWRYQEFGVNWAFGIKGTF